MNTKQETSASALDTAKLVLAIVVLLAGIGGFYYFQEQWVVVRALGVVVAVGLALLIAAQTTQGRELWNFIQGSRVELRKVIWPTRQETFQTTLIVFGFVIIMGLFFWGLDALLLFITKTLTGRG